MRAGCFAELRVIHLLNRRFVPFYFNTGGPGLGKDAAAAEFVKGKVKNKWAHFTAFDAKGDALDESDIYADKDGILEFLTALLRKHPEYDRFTPEEKKALAIAKDRPDDAAAQQAAGLILEELGRYDEAAPHYRRILAGDAAVKARAEAYRGLARMARHAKKWNGLGSILAELEKEDAGKKLTLAADVATERGYQLLADKKYKELRELLEGSIKAHPDSTRMGEMRFYAGVACFFLKDIDSAYFHWCWVVENIPDDHMQKRCYIAAAHKGMPYPNPELGGYQSNHKGGNIQVIRSAYVAARKVYERIKNNE